MRSNSPIANDFREECGDRMELTAARKETIREASKRKMSFLEAEYWRMRNGRQDYMRCPYCSKGRHGRKRNHEDKPVCCLMFAKAFGAILERQLQVDIAASHVRNLNKMGLVN